MKPTTNSDIVIGVDGGGTKCRFAMLYGGTRFEVERGPANVSTDLTGTLVTLSEGFDKLAQASGLTKRTLKSASVYLGLAGVLGEKATQKVAREMQFENVAVADDRTTAVVGALGNESGVVFGIGTGSFLGHQKGDKITLHGGWGFTLGDQASGADLGRMALRRVLLGIDGLIGKSDLTDALLREFGGSAAIVDFAAWARPSELAKYAPRVVDAARDGDENGTAIMAEGADFIQRSVRAMGWKPGVRLCPTGGLAPHYVEFFPANFARYISSPDGTALDGALLLAARLKKRGFQQ